MKIGKLRHRVKFESPKTSENAAGETITTWEDPIYRWARVRPLNGVERVANAKLQSSSTHEVLVRYTDQITTDMRMTYRTRVYQVDAIVDVEERHEEMLLTCHLAGSKL